MASNCSLKCGKTITAPLGPTKKFTASENPNLEKNISNERRRTEAIQINRAVGGGSTVTIERGEADAIQIEGVASYGSTAIVERGEAEAMQINGAGRGSTATIARRSRCYTDKRGRQGGVNGVKREEKQRLYR